MKHISEIIEVQEFIRESNAIEGVYDEESYQQAMKAWEYLMTQNVLTLDVIKETHKILMYYSDLEVDEIGQFRKIDVWIGKHKGFTPKSIEPMLQMRFCFESMRKIPPPEWQQLHIIYEKIHPFVDGNGRTGRMFMNWTRVKRCGLPVLVIKESQRQEYYKWFR